MVDRGFGVELEDAYGQMVAKKEFNPDWWSEADTVDFKLNDEAITMSGSSRMNRKARAGVMKPTGNTSTVADLQQLTWYFRGYLDNYEHTASGTNHIHEFWGGEGKELQSFRAILMEDMLKKYIYGMTMDQFTLEVSDSEMTVGADWIYKTEKAGIIGVNDESFTRPLPLTREDLFIMFYDVELNMNNLPIDGVSTAFSFEGNNNHNVDATIGLGSRYPQKRALAGKRENSISITTTLTKDTVRSILDAQYGEVDALEPSACKILQVPLEVIIRHCEDSTQYCKILFPKCTLRVEFSLSGVDDIETTISLETLGTGTTKLNDDSTVSTDMYVKLVNYQRDLSGEDVIFAGDNFTYNTEYVSVADVDEGTSVTNIGETGSRVYIANRPFDGTTYDWEAPYTVKIGIVRSSGTVSMQICDNSSHTVERTLSQVGIDEGGNLTIVNDGENISFYKDDVTEPVYTAENNLVGLNEIRFGIAAGASVVYRSFLIYSDKSEEETAGTKTLNLNRTSISPKNTKTDDGEDEEK